MHLYELQRAQHLPQPPDEVFGFFGDAANLERITPPWLRFELLRPDPVELGVGALLEYRLRLHGLPVRWRTRIEQWEPGYRFVDVQIRGPYRLWHHTHLFESEGSGTLMRDRVRYALPLGPLGRGAHAAFVRRDLRRIFDYRTVAVAGGLG